MITSSERPNFAISMTSWLVNRLRSEGLSWPAVEEGESTEIVLATLRLLEEIDPNCRPEWITR
jgi:hypothetical protein